jgi:hypothetical protein
MLTSSCSIAFGLVAGVAGVGAAPRAAGPAPAVARAHLAPATRPQDRIEGWRGDLDSWLAAVAREHYVWRGKELPEELLARADWLIEELPGLSDQRVLAELERLAALLGDGHTTVRQFASRFETTALPLRFYVFSDGLFVIDAHAGFERWIGSQVLAIGATPTDALLERIAAYISLDNVHGVRWGAPRFLRLTGMLEAVAEGIDPTGIRVTLRPPGSEPSEVELAPVVEPPLDSTPKLMPSRLPDAPPPPLYLRDVPRSHWLERLDERTVYAQCNQFVNDEGAALADFAARLRQALEEHAPARLVFDVRHNNGGDGSLLTPLVYALRDYDARPGTELVVLMGRNTFSAAQIFLARVERETEALFAGEPSSSSPNFVGESNSVALPWSGASANISNRYHETIPGDSREFIPADIPLELSSSDYFANRDPLLEQVLARPLDPSKR